MNAGLQLRVLGPFQVEQNGRLLTRFESDKARALLAYLALAKGPHSRESLSALFWPELDAKAARHNLSQVLFSLRQLLAEAAARPLFLADRYAIHELLRQFAAAKLAQAPEVEAAARDRHSTHYCAFLYEHTENWHTGWQLETLAAVTLESANVEQACRWALAQGKWRRLAQTTDSLAWYYTWHGRFQDAETTFQAMVERAEKRATGATTVAPDRLLLWARALSWLGWFTDDNSLALRRLQQSPALLERLEIAGQDTRREKASVFLLNGWRSLDLDLQEARQLIEQSLALYRELSNQWGIAESLKVLGYADWRTGNYDSGLDRAQTALTIHQQRGDRQVQVTCMAFARYRCTPGNIRRLAGKQPVACSLSRNSATGVMKEPCMGCWANWLLSSRLTPERKQHLPKAPKSFGKSSIVSSTFR